jgi:hypothetical protein
VNYSEPADWKMILEKKDKFDSDNTKKPENETNFLFGFPNCGSSEVIKSSRVPFTLYNTGKVRIENNIFDHNSYCISDVRPNSHVNPNSLHDAIIIRCEYPWISEVVHVYLVCTLLVTSAVFLLFLFIHVAMNSAHKLFGAMELSVIFNLFLYNVVVTIVKLWSPNSLYHNNPGLCFMLGIIIQFSYLSFIFWLNAMSFDVWTTFRQMRATNIDLMSKTANRRLSGFKFPKYRWYALFGWGIPSVVMVVTMVMQISPPYLFRGFIGPGIGKENCFLQSGWASFYYLYMIAGIALLSNLAFFGLFAWNMRCGVWSNQDLSMSQRYLNAKFSNFSSIK